ncbi:hypothetical protein K435DRAFT_860924 [Dendrothele bispora CBS 962.96]|uniref:Uncharacterized protein n=1 Tax=Dendrothele bispora (strain CBS 962.96) TaxID=1314807 RepID=A0A4S8LWK0_DENBC|nr:hypothetical protein K435DRAFT_860924 [Dendrothele bispora CBS 962.96]
MGLLTAFPSLWASEVPACAVQSCNRAQQSINRGGFVSGNGKPPSIPEREGEQEVSSATSCYPTSGQLPHATASPAASIASASVCYLVQLIIVALQVLTEVWVTVPESTHIMEEALYAITEPETTLPACGWERDFQNAVCSDLDTSRLSSWNGQHDFSERPWVERGGLEARYEVADLLVDDGGNCENTRDLVHERGRDGAILYVEEDCCTVPLTKFLGYFFITGTLCVDGQGREGERLKRGTDGSGFTGNNAVLPDGGYGKVTTSSPTAAEPSVQDHGQRMWTSSGTGTSRQQASRPQSNLSPRLFPARGPSHECSRNYLHRRRAGQPPRNGLPDRHAPPKVARKSRAARSMRTTSRYRD